MPARSTRNALLAIFSATTLSVTGLAHADPPRSGVRLDGLQSASADSTFFRAEGPHEKQPGTTELGLSLGVDFAEAPLRVVSIDEDGEGTDVTKVVERALVMRAGASISPAYWVWMDLQAPFVLFEQTGITGSDLLFAGQSVRAATAPALGDLRFGLHFRPIDTDVFDLIIGGRYWAAVGSIDSYLSDGRFRAEADVGAAGRVGKISYGCTISIAPMFFASRDGDRVAASCAVHGQAMPWLSIGVEPAFAVFRDIVDARSAPEPLDRITYQVEPLVAARFSYEGFSAALTGGPGFGDAPGAPQARVMLQLAYRIDGKPKPPPPPPAKPTDIDLDGIPNDADACPEVAGPDNTTPQLRGCPILDTDGDLIRDEEDACPAKAGAKHPDVKANGCPDSDNDLLPDPIDTCRNEPGDAKNNGCPVFAHLEKKGFSFTPALSFDGTATLSKNMRAALEEIAATMRANPKLGHVSIVLGTKGAPASISDKRAEQISLVLLGANVDSQRFEVVLQDSLRSGAVEVRLVK
ncbi:MAG: thrombospondin type 3 repeat-containing protein [Polyangiaceae bacterium]